MLLFVVENYKREYFQNNKVELEAFRRIFNREKTRAINELPFLVNSDIKVSSASGQFMNLPHIAWIAFINRRISASATKGFYVVYLFDDEFQNVYLSLNQGWTYFEKRVDLKTKLEKRAEAKRMANEFRKLASFSQTETYDHEINLLIAKNPLAEGYTACNIISKKYPLANLPDEEDLVRDLSEFLRIYSNIVKIHQSSNEINKTLATPIETTSKPIIDFTDTGLIEIIEPPKIGKMSKKSKNDRDSTKRDFAKENAAKKSNGEIGEKFIYDYEIDRLNKLMMDSSKVKWISQTNDSAGYDIESLNNDGSKRFIEVKSTTGGEKSAFNMSINEIDKFEENENNYYIYRVINVLGQKRRCFIIDYEYFKKLYKSPTQFLVYLKEQ